MGALQERLWEITEKAGHSIPLSADELGFAESCLTAPDSGVRANACEVIFRASESPQAKSLALNELEHLCRNTSEEDYAVTLLNVLLYVSLDDIVTRAPLRGFVFRSASSTRWPIRTNAVSVLERLARTGDREALRKIEHLAEDDDDNYVQTNARNSLGRLTE
jgi:hypothetical protein